MSAGADPFGTAALRTGVLAAWRDSPTRLREDAATEADLVRAGYRDRLLTELAQNAADAAAKGGVPGRLVVRLDGRALHISNTGAPLDVSGVHALTALRASAKADPAVSVGRFGVGFTAVRAVSDDIEVRSTTGSIHFSRDLTWAALRDSSITIPVPADTFTPPILRLAWSTTAAPADNAATEIVIQLRPDVDAEDLLAAMRTEVVDLLLELPALQSIRIAEDEFVVSTADLGIDDPISARLPGTGGIADDFTLDPAAPTRVGLRELRIDGPAQRHLWWEYRTPRARWLLPIRDGRPVPAPQDVLRAPTRSDEELSLPALVIADITMQPDRRRVLPGAPIAEIATGYADFARALPPRDRLVLVPAPGFARSEVDALLREALVRELQTHPWLPVVATHPSSAGSDHDTAALLLGDPAAASTGPDVAATLPGADVAAALPGPDVAAASSSTGAAAALPGPDAAAVLPGADAAAASPGAGTATASPSPDAAAALPGPDVAAALSSADAAAALPDPDVAAASPGADVAAALSGADAAAVLSSADTVTASPDADMAADLLRTDTAAAAQVAVPTRTSAFTGLTAELAELLDEVVGPLLIPELSGHKHTEALGVLDVHRLGLARLAELSSGLERSPQWWHSLYAALEPFVLDPLSAEELGALAVPLADGRLVTGPRTVVLDDQLDIPIPVHWARLVHPAAVHPLLARLGARSATAEDLLSDPGLRAELTDNPGDPDTADAVLRLAAHADPTALPLWLGLLELPDTTGELRPADELLLPDAPLHGLLAEDAPFGTLDPDLVDRYGAEALQAVGVGWDFGIVVEDDPTGPDHDLDDEEAWWSGLAQDPRQLVAVRDLDLVDEIAWPDALQQLAASPRTRRLLTDKNGYTAWWLRRHARIDGTPLGLLRHPADAEFAGLLPAFDFPALGSSVIDALPAVLADADEVVPELAEALLSALADPSKTPLPEVISRTHARLATAVAEDRLDLADLRLPDRVRALSGAVVDPDDAWVLDQPWLGLVLPPDRLVAGEIATAPALARLLDLPLASAVITAEVLGEGRRSTWSAEPLGVVLRQLFTLPDQGDLVLHDDLRVRLRGARSATVSVPWWHDGTTTHIQTPQHRE